MIIQIKVRDDNGKYADAAPRDFALVAFRRILDFDLIDGWGWMRASLCSFCLLQAEWFSSENSAKADLWISRYQAIRRVQ